MARESAILVEKMGVIMVSKDTVSVSRPSLCRSEKARADRSLGLGLAVVGNCWAAGRDILSDAQKVAKMRDSEAI